MPPQMVILFFRLAGVPEDEADDVRELLTNNDIGFYETTAGNWGVSMPAIWLYQHEDLPRAQMLFDNYQQHRAVTQRSLYQQSKQNGETQGFWRHNLNKPLRFLAYCAVLALIVYVSIKWLFELGL